MAGLLEREPFLIYLSDVARPRLPKGFSLVHLSRRSACLLLTVGRESRISKAPLRAPSFERACRLDHQRPIKAHQQVGVEGFFFNILLAVGLWRQVKPSEPSSARNLLFLIREASAVSSLALLNIRRWIASQPAKQPAKTRQHLQRLSARPISGQKLIESLSVS